MLTYLYRIAIAVPDGIIRQSRKEIAHCTGFSLKTAQAIIDRLIHAGILESVAVTTPHYEYLLPITPLPGLTSVAGCQRIIRRQL